MASAQPTNQIDGSSMLVGLARQARQAESAKRLQFLLVNQTHQLVQYLLGILWVEDEGVVIQSGVSYIERNSHYALWLNDVCQTLSNHEACQVLPSMLQQSQVDEWGAHLPENVYWFPVVGGKRKAGLLLCREHTFSDAEIIYLTEWLDIWAYSWTRVDAPTVYGELTRFWLNFKAVLPTFNQLKQSIDYERIQKNPEQLFLVIFDKVKSCFVSIARGFQWVGTHGVKAAWLKFLSEIADIWHNKKRRWKWLILILILFPVRLSVLVPGGLVPANPAIIRVPIEGVVDEFYVSPNQQVVKGQPLFSLDLTLLQSRLHVAQQEIQIANQEYRQSALQALTDAKSRGMLGPQEGKSVEKKVEADYLKDLLDKAKIISPRAGVVMFDDPSEWIGKPVTAGEKVMVVASDGDVEIEGWIPVGEAIDLPKNAPATLYLNAMPFSPVSGKLRYEGHEPILRPDSGYAYRIRVSLDPGQKCPRVGLKGTAKVKGGFVPLSYWVLRRPISSLRQFFGL
jgi:hypothetical protein